MNAQNSYQLCQIRQAEALRNAEMRQLVQQAQAVQPSNRVYNVALAQVGRGLVALGQRLQSEANVEPVLENA